MTYGTSVQGIYGTGSAAIGANPTRQTDFVNKTPSSGASLYYPPETATNLSVSMS